MNTWAILHIINAGFLAVLMIIHFRFTKKDYQANRLFSLTLFSLAYESFLMFLFSTTLILKVPHFGRTGTLALYLIYPSAYLYVRNLLNQEKLKWTDLIHLLPIVLYIVDFSAYFLQSAEMKRQQMQIDYATDNLYIAQSPQLFPKYFHFRLRTILSLIYIALSFKVWINIFYKQSQQEILTENKSVMQWTFALCVLLIIGIFPASIVDFFNISINLATIQNLSMYITTISFAIFLFFRPDIVYGVKGLWVVEPIKVTTPEIEKEQAANEKLTPEIKKVYLKEETVEKLAMALQENLLRDKAYLINSYSITDLSIAVGYPTHQVSAYLNTHLGMNFNEYINSQRIDYLLKQFSEKPEWRVFTLEALGQKVGFNNRYTFLNAFKKSTGETPSVYLKKWKTE